MFDFYNSDYLLYGLPALLCLLAGSILSYIYRRKQWLKIALRKEMRDLLMPERVGIKRIIRDTIFLLALLLLIVALARPQTPGNVAKSEEQKGVEVMLCIDVSNSMLSPDVAPSRMSFAKRSLSKLLDDMQSDKVGIVVFAADAYVQLPITTDLRTAQEFLRDVSPEMLTAQGTDIARAIKLSRSAFSDRDDIGKSIIVVTDGESHEGGAEEAAKAASDAGIRVSVIGVGSVEGGVIPTDNGYLKDLETGEIVTTRLNAEMCEAVAEAGEGAYINTTSTDELVRAVEKELDTLPKATIGTVDRAGYVEHFIPWLIGAMVLLIAELFVMQRRNRIWAKLNLFGYERKQ